MKRNRAELGKSDFSPGSTHLHRLFFKTFFCESALVKKVSQNTRFRGRTKRHKETENSALMNKLLWWINPIHQNVDWPGWNSRLLKHLHFSSRVCRWIDSSLPVITFSCLAAAFFQTSDCLREGREWAAFLPVIFCFVLFLEPVAKSFDCTTCGWGLSQLQPSVVPAQSVHFCTMLEHNAHNRQPEPHLFPLRKHRKIPKTCCL